jgi:signal transduction histidine kinase
MPTTQHPDAVSLLSDIAIAIGESDDVDSLAARCVASVRSLFRADSSHLWLIDESATGLDLRASSGPAGESLHRIPMGESVIGQLASNRNARVADPGSAEFGLGIELWAHAEGLTAFAGCPLMLRGKLIGALGIFARHHFGERTLSLLGSLAPAISAGVERKQTEEENARLYEELQRTTESLQRANAVKSEFLGLISHELRSPIATVIGNGMLLLKRGHLLGEEDKMQALTDMVSEGERLQRVIENLLFLVRTEAGHKLDVEPVYLPRLVEGAIEAFNRRHPGRDVIVKNIGDSPVALGEPTLIALVVDNLISNANKYSPAEAQIEVHIGQSESGLPQVRVRDDGIGLDEVDVDTLFVPFYRSSKAKTHAKGVGLGLAVCKRIVDAQNGRIWAESRPEGGSDFVFTLQPAGQPDES